VKALDDLGHDALPLRGGDPSGLPATTATWREALVQGGATLSKRARYAFQMLIVGQRMKAERHPWAEAQLEVGQALVLRLPPEEASELIEWAGELERMLPPLASIRSCSSDADAACSAPCPRGRCRASPKGPRKKRRGRR
jgi:hypothetical protein